MIGDLWALYRLDFYEAVWAQRVSILLQCISRLAVEPNSLWRAKQLGGEKWFGWSPLHELVASLIDGQTFQTQATAQNKKAKYKQVVDRPQAKQKTTYKPKSVKTMNLRSFFSGIGK